MRAGAAAAGRTRPKSQHVPVGAQHIKPPTWSPNNLLLSSNMAVDPARQREQPGNVNCMAGVLLASNPAAQTCQGQGGE
jgi:hypothetical protein